MFEPSMESSLARRCPPGIYVRSNKSENEGGVNQRSEGGCPQGDGSRRKANKSKMNEGGAEQGEEQAVSPLGGDAEDTDARLVAWRKPRQHAHAGEQQRDGREEQRGGQRPGHPGEVHCVPPFAAGCVAFIF